MEIAIIFFLAVMGIAQSSLIDSCNITKRFVERHNWRRLQLAKGAVDGQPAASKMTYLSWDEELATKAANWASKNKYAHNPNKTIPSGRFKTGENIYIYKTTVTEYKFDPELAITSWWNEYKDYKFKKFAHSSLAKSTGHYTQMAWADSVKLGCAVSNYRENNWNCFLVVCNYGPPGNFVGNFPYVPGQAANRLVCGDKEKCALRYGKKCKNRKHLN